MTRFAGRGFAVAPATAALLALGACGTDTRTTDSAAGAPAAINTTGTPIDSTARTDSAAVATAMTPSPAMANMTGDADHDFLRMMSDHHKGLVEMAHPAKEQKDAGTVPQDAARLDTKQDAELDRMMTMLEKEYSDPYSPTVRPDNQQMADSLRGKTGKEYARAFYRNVIQHHEQGIRMIDEYLPKAKNATLKQMAEKMKAEQAREIREFQGRIAKLGS